MYAGLAPRIIPCSTTLVIFAIASRTARPVPETMSAEHVPQIILYTITRVTFVRTSLTAQLALVITSVALAPILGLLLTMVLSVALTTVTQW